MTARAQRTEQLCQLLRASEPSLRWRGRVRIRRERRDSSAVRRLEEEIRHSPRVQRLLAPSRRPFRAGTVRNVYYPWQGVHWTLAKLADLGYPSGDPELAPLGERVLGQWTRPAYGTVYTAAAPDYATRTVGVPVIRGRARRCASQQGNALFAASVLGLGGPHLPELAKLLERWQWPDGGWNCDRRPDADTSSFMETLTPMVGLQAYADRTGDRRARRAAARASEVFLSRRLFRRRSDGAVIDRHFVRLHYPLYWHYDVLAGLKGIAQVGRIDDPRCREALDWLESRELPRGGWPADERYYRAVSRSFDSSCESVEWGPTAAARANPWVTSDALAVLAAAGRFEP